MRTTEQIVESVLSAAQREAWRACRAPGEMPVREFARETGRRPGTVGNHLRRAERKLQEATAAFVEVAEPVDFLTARDDNTASFQRAREQTARVRYISPVVYTVALGGDRHVCALYESDGGYKGACDCKGWEYHDGPCAHLCALRMADFVNEETVNGTEVRTPTLDVEASARRAVADGGREIVGAGHDGRVFGRPEGRL